MIWGQAAFFQNGDIAISPQNYEDNCPNYSLGHIVLSFAKQSTRKWLSYQRIHYDQPRNGIKGSKEEYTVLLPRSTLYFDECKK